MLDMLKLGIAMPQSDFAAFVKALEKGHYRVLKFLKNADEIKYVKLEENTLWALIRWNYVGFPSEMDEYQFVENYLENKVPRYQMFGLMDGELCKANTSGLRDLFTRNVYFRV